jgi:hypothetical protein
MLLHINGMFNGEIEIISRRKVPFLTDLHSQFRGVGQGMKQTYLYLWSPLLQAQWDRCDQRNHQA